VSGGLEVQVPGREAIEALIAELEAQKAALEDPIEGLTDLARLNIQEETQAAVNALLRQYRERGAKLDRAIRSLEALLEDGYPTLPQPDFSAAVTADVQDQDRTVSVAAALFGFPAQATTLNVTTGPAVPK
jgi:hypothetical protein